MLSTRQRGFSLTEMMIASTIGLILLGAVVQLFGATVGSNAQFMKTARLNEELRMIMSLMIRDLRRAGYWEDSVCSMDPSLLDANTLANTCGGAGGQNNPFAGIAINAAGDCLLYSYDLNRSGVLDANVPNVTDERLGFRLHGGALEMRRGGAACTEGGWEDLSDPAIVTVTGLQFNSAGSATLTNGLTVAEVDITLSARLAHDAGVARTLAERVRLRNDLTTAGITLAQ